MKNPFSKAKNTKMNILITGPAGSGKNSLIRKIIPEGDKPRSIYQDFYIGNGISRSIKIDVYETEIANFIIADEIKVNWQSFEEYVAYILNAVSISLRDEKSEKNCCSIWYCVDGSCLPLADTICDIKSQCNILFVITKCGLMRKEKKENVMNTLPGCIKREQIIMVSEENMTDLLNQIYCGQDSN